MILHNQPAVVVAAEITPQTFWVNLIKTKGTRAENLGAGGIEVSIRNPDRFLNLRTLVGDCLLKENADRCPGRSGTVQHFLDAEHHELKIVSHIVKDMQELVFRHRRDDAVLTV